LEKVRLGIIGVGNVSRLNVPGYLGHPRCEVAALCDRNLERAKALAVDWGVSQVYASVDDLLAVDEIDAVEILTPTYLHAEHVIKAALAGKHVSCQKPIAASVEDALRMIDVCAASRVQFRISENCCYYPPLARAKQLVADGVIGAPSVVRIKTVVGDTDSEFQARQDPEGYVWRLDSRSPGGHLFDDVMHKYAMALWLVDEDVSAVQAVVRNGRLFFEAPTVALLEYARDDLLGMIEVSHAPGMFIESDWYGADEFFEIQGEDGFVWVTRLSGRLHDLPPLVVRSGKTKIDVLDIDDRYEAGFERSAAAFIDGILDGVPADLTPLTGLKSLQLAFAVYQSSNEMRRIDPSGIRGSVSPNWWPKSTEELIADAIALGYLEADDPVPSSTLGTVSHDDS
jgi:predicted dehydrogenase